MAQQMTVEEGDSPDDWVRKVHHEIDTSFGRNVDSIQPLGLPEASFVEGIHEKVNLVDVKRVHLMATIYDAPMMESSDRYGLHRRIQWTILLVIDVKAVLIFRKGNGKVSRAVFNARN